VRDSNLAITRFFKPETTNIPFSIYVDPVQRMRLQIVSQKNDDLAYKMDKIIAVLMGAKDSLELLVQTFSAYYKFAIQDWQFLG
jgi:hypothetical protein